MRVEEAAAATTTKTHFLTRLILLKCRPVAVIDVHEEGKSPAGGLLNHWNPHSSGTMGSVD
jgi:hypothetical protein